MLRRKTASYAGFVNAKLRPSGLSDFVEFGLILRHACASGQSALPQFHHHENIVIDVILRFYTEPARRSESETGLTLPPLEAAGFLLHHERPAVAGLTLAPQAFYVSVCPTATSILTPSSLTFLAAL